MSEKIKLFAIAIIMSLLFAFVPFTVKGQVTAHPINQGD